MLAWHCIHYQHRSLKEKSDLHINRLSDGADLIYVSRTVNIHGLLTGSQTNRLSEICFDDAQQRAEELDLHLRSTGQTFGPLHGLPDSLKDQFHVDGLDSACGYATWVGSPKSVADEGVIVRNLKQAGAIVFVKTNVPMSMLIGETTNNIIGSTINSFVRNLTAGGASGGEGALLALRGSPLARSIPSSFNNLFGLRPSIGRISTTGLATSLPGLPTATSVARPMAADLASISAKMKWIINSNSWQDDHDVINMKWSEEECKNTYSRICQPGKANGTFVFAIMNSDEHVVPHPPVQRAIQMIRFALQRHGYEVIEWRPPPHCPATDNYFQILGSTAGQEIRDAVNATHEPPIGEIADLFRRETITSLPTSEFWKLFRLREEFRTKYHEYWKSTKNLTASKTAVDGVILPVAAHAAPLEGQYKYYAYSTVPSILDYATGSIPVTFADRFIDKEVILYEPRNLSDRANWQNCQKDIFDGSPVGLQVMGQRLQEEKVLVMMEAITSAIQECFEFM